jgi:hypothetical protein
VLFTIFKTTLANECYFFRVIKECSAEFRISSVVEIHEVVFPWIFLYSLKSTLVLASSQDQHVADIVKSVSKIPVDSGSVISKNPGAMSMSLECPLVAAFGCSPHSACGLSYFSAFQVDITTDSRQYSIITDVIRSLLARNETEVEKFSLIVFFCLYSC